MTNVVDDILEHISGLWRLRWPAAWAAWVLCALGWLVVFLIPDEYEATARVYVDTRTALRPAIEDIGIERDVDAEINQVRQALLSRPQLAKVAQTTNLDAHVGGDQSELDSVINDLRDSIAITSESRPDAGSGRAGDSLYTITYRHESRAKSLSVVQTLLDTFVEGTLGGNSQDAEKAQTFLEQQLREYGERLSDAEARLAEFRKKNLGLVPGDKGDIFARLDAEMQGLQTAETNLAVALSRRSELNRQLRGTPRHVPGTSAGGGGALAGASGSDLSLRVQESEAKLEELLLRFTDKHPEVVALRDTIRELKQREAKELAEIARGGSGSGAIRSLNSNPVYQNAQLQLNQADVDVASLRGAIAQHKSEIASLRKFVDLAPQVEQEFARLTRDYDTTKATYTALLGRLERARVSDDAEQAGIIQFEVIDPPAADVMPVFPNRALLILAVLAAGLLGAAAIAFILQQLQPAVGSVRALQDLTGLPVLGSVSLFATEDSQAARRQERYRLAIAAASLVGVCFLLLIVERPAARLLHGMLG